MKDSFVVVIPTLNRADDLKRCLDAIMAQTVKPDQVCVIDNGSTDGTPALLKRYPVQMKTAPDVPVSRLFNLGWKWTDAQVIAYLNDDAEPVADWLERIEESFDAFPNAAIVGGPTIAMREQEIFKTYQALSRSKALNWLARFYDGFIHEGRLLEAGAYSEGGAYSIGGSLRSCLEQDAAYPVAMLSITNMAVRRSVLEQVGGFDESFRYAHIDGDLFLRLRERGAQLVFNPKAVVWHYVNPTGLTRSAYVLGRDTAHLYRKHLPPHSPVGWLRFLSNIAFINSFWLYRAISQRRVEPLRGNLGFLAGSIGR